MSKFFESLLYNDTLTENGMPTHSTSGSYLVDLFYKAGGWRNVSDIGSVVYIFSRALEENPLLAIRCLFYIRDARLGLGERRVFRILYRWLALYKTDLAEKVMQYVPYYGRWDDLFVLFDTNLEKKMADFVLDALMRGDRLCAKWMPRENKHYNQFAKRFMKHFGLTPKNYRRLLSGKTDVVENKMCKNLWNQIEYSSVPSLAFKRYRNAFARHDNERFYEFIRRVLSGNAKVNAGAIYPHQVLGSLFIRGKRLVFEKDVDKDVIQAQWNNLPDFITDGLNIFPICDTSGSMFGEPLNVSVALGIYIAERNKSAFKNELCIFSEKPVFIKLTSQNVVDKLSEITSINALNTDISAVFDHILNNAIKFGVKQEDFPEVILLLSDMQFDVNAEEFDNFYDIFERKFAAAGYKLPKLVFWNLRTSFGVPVKKDKSNTILISGFSPSIMRHMLNARFEPEGFVKQVLTDKRYSAIEI